MKTNIKFLILLLPFFLVNTSFAYNACKQGNMMIEYECQDSSCNSTATEYHPRDSIQQDYTTLAGFSKTSYSVFNYIDKNINGSNRYITMDNYCNNPSVDSKGTLSCNSVYDKSVKISDLLYANHSIYLIIGSKDKDGDYTNGNYKKFNDGGDLLDYQNIKIQVPRVCIDSDCNPTNYTTYNSTSSSTFNLLYGGYKNTINLTQLDEPDVISWGLSSQNYKIGLTTTPVTINATFRDYFPSGCNNPLSYKLQSITPFEGTNMEVNDVVSTDNTNVTIIKQTPNYIEWKISEGFRFNNVGNNYVKATVTDGYPNNITKNSSYISVIAGDVNENQSKLISMQSRLPGIKYYAKSSTTSGSVLAYEIYLKDISGNPVTLPIKVLPTNNIDKIINYPTGNINSDGNGKYSFTLQFNNKTNSYFENFKIIVPNTDNYGAINGTYSSIILSANPSPLPIYSDQDPGNDFTSLTCTNKNIKITASCTWDDLSGCATNEYKVFSSNSDNGKTGILYLKDNAGNNTNGFRYEINHIDKTIPTINSYNIGGRILSVKANSNMNLNINLGDYTPSGCDPKINYSLSLNNIKANIIKTGNVSTPYDFSLNHDFSKTGEASVNFTLKDAAGNIGTYTKTIKIIPDDSAIASSSQVGLINSVQKSTLYPGSSYNYQVYLKDKYNNPIYSKTIDSINYLGTSALKTNMTNIDSPSGDNVYNINYTNYTTDSDGKIIFNFKSLAPGIFNETFGIRLNYWDDNYNDLTTQGTHNIGLGGANYFLKPRTGNLSVLTPGGALKLNSDNKIKLSLSEKPISNFPGYTVENFKGKLLSSQSLHSITKQDDVLDLTTSPLITFRLEANSDAGVNIKPGVKVNPIISYQLEGKTISYLLSTQTNPNDETPIGINNPKEALSGVRILGNSQGTGKQELATGKGKFSDVSKLNSRTKIRKTAYDLIKNMTSGKTFGGISYKDCTNKTGNDQDFELPSVSSDITFITKNCNIIIGSNVNTSGKRLGIIVLRDNQSKEEIGNVYIKKNVNYINAIIYADGGFISTGFPGGDKINNYKDSLDRTENLQNQLVLKGTLFTRNTIGGAIKGSSTYLLPGGQKTGDYNKAMAYDLNYIRRENVGWDDIGFTKKYNLGYQEPFVIVYNPIIQINPPKGFFSK